MRTLSILFIAALLFITAGAYAEFTEDFDTFSLGTLVAQESWEANSGIDVVTSGAGRALKTNNTSDKTIRHDTTGVDFALALDKDGIEYGFEMNEGTSGSSSVSVMMYLRDGGTATLSPGIGLNQGVFSIRANPWSGDHILGNALYHFDSSVWEKGDWISIKVILTGEGFDTATLVAYNITKGVEIPTGLSGISLGVNPKYHASWNRMNLRTAVSADTTFDNVYVTDYTAPAPSTFVEDFEALILGSIDQAGWRDNAPGVTVVNTPSSGEYVGSKAMKSGSTGDEWPQYATDRSEDFDIQVGIFDGIEMGFDFREDDTSSTNCKMHLREGMTANYSPAFGIVGDLTGGYFTIRLGGETGIDYRGLRLHDANQAGLWDKGDWVRVKLVLRGTDYNYATLYAYNLTKSVEIPTGLANINLGTNPKARADAWDRITFRLASSVSTYVDNAYAADYVNTNVFAENPDPADKAYPVATENVTLSWISGSSVESHKVYFGTSADPNQMPLLIETADTFYDLPFDLDKGVTYYWRVDSVVDGSDPNGFVWSFTTELEPFSYPRRMAYDGFEYTAGIDLKQEGNGFGGFGWASGWERELGEYCYVTVGSGSLTPGMDYPYGTKGNRIEHFNDSTSGNDAIRKLDYPIDLRRDQDYYISYLAMGDGDTYNSCVFRLMEGKTGGSEFGVDMFYEGYIPLVTTPMFYIRDFSGGWTSNAVAGWSGGVVSVVVVKIDANVTGDDIVSVSVFNDTNPMPMEEPTTWQQTISGDMDTSYGWLQFAGRADSFDRWHVDEVHVGTGWGAVTGHVEACGDLGTIMYYDINEDCFVTLGDFAPIAEDWLRCTDPAGEDCEWVYSPDDPNFTSLFTDLGASSLKVYETFSDITIDGDITEWDGVRWYNARFASGYQPANAVDVTDAKVALLWDPLNPQYVFMALKVTDTEQNFTDAPANWNDGENIEARFTYNDLGTSAAWYDNETFDTAQLYQLFNKASGGSWCTLGPVAASTDDPATNDIDVAYASSVDGDMIVYEMALPVYSSYDINTGTGTKVSLMDGDVIAFNLQINSVSTAGAGGLYEDQSHVPSDWPAFTVTANSSLSLGDLGFFKADIDENGEVGVSDIATIGENWLSCTDPETQGCDQPWAP